MPACPAEVPLTESPSSERRRSAARDAENASRQLEVLFKEHAPFLVRVVTRMVGSVARAEDVVQRAFMTAHRKGLPGEGDQDVARAWLYRVTMNELRHERRSIARRSKLATAVGGEPAPTPQQPDQQLETRSTAAEVRAVIGELPPPQREVFVLYELEQLSGAEISSMLEVPENTVWSRLRLARARFKKLWVAHVQEEAEA